MKLTDEEILEIVKAHGSDDYLSVEDVKEDDKSIEILNALYHYLSVHEICYFVREFKNTSFGNAVDKIVENADFKIKKEYCDKLGINKLGEDAPVVDIPRAKEYYGNPKVVPHNVSQFQNAPKRKTKATEDDPDYDPGIKEPKTPKAKVSAAAAASSSTDSATSKESVGKNSLTQEELSRIARATARDARNHDKRIARFSQMREFDDLKEKNYNIDDICYFFAKLSYENMNKIMPVLLNDKMVDLFSEAKTNLGDKNGRLFMGTFLRCIDLRGSWKICDSDNALKIVEILSGNKKKFKELLKTNIPNIRSTIGFEERQDITPELMVDKLRSFFGVDLAKEDKASSVQEKRKVNSGDDGREGNYKRARKSDGDSGREEASAAMDVDEKPSSRPTSPDSAALSKELQTYKGPDQ